MNWHPAMQDVLDYWDSVRENRRRPFPRRMESCTWDKNGKNVVLMSRRRYVIWQVRLIPSRLNTLLCHLRWWRRFRFDHHHPEGCLCTFEDAEIYTHSSHPTDTCPLRDDCRTGYSAERCGGCDGCIDDQQDYYEAQRRGLL